MTNNYNQATVWPELPASHLIDAEIQSLAVACGLRCEQHDGLLYFFSEEFFSEEGEDLEGEHIDCTEVLRAKLRQLDPSSYPYIAIEGAATCSKMRSGEFGGFAYFITREAVQYVSTWQWLYERKTSIKENCI